MGHHPPIACISLTDDETDSENDETKRSKLRVVPVRDISPIYDIVAASEQANKVRGFDMLDAQVYFANTMRKG